jgi:hypothetical protein
MLYNKQSLKIQKGFSEALIEGQTIQRPPETDQQLLLWENNHPWMDGIWYEGSNWILFVLFHFAIILSVRFRITASGDPLYYSNFSYIMERNSSSFISVIKKLFDTGASVILYILRLFSFGHYIVCPSSNYCFLLFLVIFKLYFI